MKNKFKINKRSFQEQTYTFYFYREDDGSWYIDFPEYIEQGIGTKENLEMVAGADQMLEYFAPNGAITITFSNAPLPNCNLSLKRLVTDLWGATYIMRSTPFKVLWLCNVSKYIFNGKHPNSLYLQLHENHIPVKH